MQVGTLAHLLREIVQKRPDAVVHPFPPHTQGAVFDVAPLVCVQSGAAMQRQ